MIHCKDEGKVLCFVRRSPATPGRDIGNDPEQNPVPQGHSLWTLVCGLAVDVGSLAQGGRVQLTESLGFVHPQVGAPKEARSRRLSYCRSFDG